VIERFPLYPGSVPSSVSVPPDALMGLPPAYRKVAQAEFQVPAGYQSLAAWFQRALEACGLGVESVVPLQQHGGPPYAGLNLVSRDGLSRLSLVFRPLSAQSTAVLYVAQTLDLPPRPASTYLRGPFVRVDVTVHMYNVNQARDHFWRFTITWPATIARLVRSINSPTQVYPGLLGGGGAVIASEKATLSFVRQDGGARAVRLSTIVGTENIGRAETLSLATRVLRLVNRIAWRRCGGGTACG
jgi:hypothetical protein